MRSIGTRWVMILTIGAGLLAGGPAPARADLWEELVRQSITPEQVRIYEGAGQSGAAWRGAAGLPLPSAGAGGQVASLSYSTGRGCGIADFAGEFQALFNANALENYFKGLVSTAISAAPLVLMCYASPTLCDAYKHFKSMASSVLQARAAECQAVEQAALDFGDRMAKRRQLQCIEEKVAGGAPRYLAQDECQALAGTQVLDFNLRGVGDMDVVDAALRKTGADAETIRLAKTLLGEVSVRSSGRELTAPAPDAAEREWARIYHAYGQRLVALVDQVRAGTAPGYEALREVSAPGVPVTADLLQAIATLPPAERAVMIQKLASALTRARLDHQLRTLEARLLAGAQLGQANQSDHILRQEIEGLRAEREKIRSLKDNVDQMAELMGEIKGAAARAQSRQQGGVPPAEQGPVYHAPTHQRQPSLGGGLLLTP